MSLSNIAIEFLNDNEDLIRKNNFHQLFIKSLGGGEWPDILYFLMKECDIPVLNYMDKIPPNFFWSSRIRELEIPLTIKSISASAFKSSKIENIIIPPTVTIIESEAFLNCKNLRRLTIPESVTSLGKKVFEGTHDELRMQTPKRTEVEKMLKIPKNEIDWYKRHLVFIPKEGSEE